jgi:hypothetical protein
MVTAVKTPNYSAAQEALIEGMSDSVGTLDLSHAETLAADPRMNASDGTPRKARSIVAKIGRMGLPYARKVAVSKTGEPVAHKRDIVAEIATVVKGNLDGLENAPKAALVAIRKAVLAA